MNKAAAVSVTMALYQLIGDEQAVIWQWSGTSRSPDWPLQKRDDSRQRSSRMGSSIVSLEGLSIWTVGLYNAHHCVARLKLGPQAYCALELLELASRIIQEIWDCISLTLKLYSMRTCNNGSVTSVSDMFRVCYTSILVSMIVFCLHSLFWCQ